MIVVLLLAIAILSEGLAVTRAMVSAYPDPRRLILVSDSGILMGERLPISPGMLEFWRARNTTLAGIAGFQWDREGTAWVTSDFFRVAGARPRRFLLRKIDNWEWVDYHDAAALGVLARLNPGVTPAAAQKELQDLAIRYRGPFAWNRFLRSIQVVPLEERLEQPLRSYGTIAGILVAGLLAAALAGMWGDWRRARRIRSRYWAYFAFKAIAAPAILVLFTFEFSPATTVTLTGGTTFLAEPLWTWLFILLCGGISWWSLADQGARCRACLRLLEYPVRIGAPGAVLFDPAGIELVCCEGHGALYLPAPGSGYAQAGGWMTN